MFHALSAAYNIENAQYSAYHALSRIASILQYIVSSHHVPGGHAHASITICNLLILESLFASPYALRT